jgi:hypothetical protein
MMSLDKLRRNAKALKKAYRAGDAAAIARVRSILGTPSTVKHADTLLVRAREAGFSSWPRLKFAVEMQAMDRAARAERLKIALYLGQDWIVQALLAAEPDLGSENFGLQCALYDIEAVRLVLERDPGAATRAIGVRSPILHLAYSKHFRAEPDRAGAMIAVADALLEAGADVNDSYPFEPGASHEISALYGALGHGGNLQLAEWLLAHGDVRFVAQYREPGIVVGFVAVPNSIDRVPLGLKLLERGSIGFLIRVVAEERPVHEGLPGLKAELRIAHRYVVLRIDEEDPELILDRIGRRLPEAHRPVGDAGHDQLRILQQKAIARFDGNRLADLERVAEVPGRIVLSVEMHVLAPVLFEEQLL